MFRSVFNKMIRRTKSLLIFFAERVTFLNGRVWESREKNIDTITRTGKNRKAPE